MKVGREEGGLLPSSSPLELLMCLSAEGDLDGFVPSCCEELLRFKVILVKSPKSLHLTFLKYFHFFAQGEFPGFLRQTHPFLL